MSLFVGTSGWAYKEWKPDFYPADLKQAAFLDHYGAQLSACEINATFYRLQKHETFERWRSAVPEQFRFAIKAHRRLTHSKTIAPDAEQKEFLTAFLRSLTPLEDRLGALLFQFPPYRKRDDEALTALMDELPVERCAFEFRDPSWDVTEVVTLITDRGGTVCVADTKGDPPSVLPGGNLAYVRLRHDEYSGEQRDAWSRLLRTEAAARPVYAFTKHEGVPAGDPFAGIGLAVWLRKATESAPDMPDRHADLR